MSFSLCVCLLAHIVLGSRLVLEVEEISVTISNTQYCVAICE